jgi:flagella basal body P-ring formation protein FlgA
MSLQIKCLVLSLSFVLGMIASSFGQSTVIENPFFKKSATSKTKPATRNAKTIVASTEKSKANLKPIANTASPLRAFEYFVPESADLLLVLRPQQRVRHELFSKFNANVPAALASPDWSFKSEKVEWFVAATSQKTVQQIQTSFHQSMFRAIQTNLDGNLEDKSKTRPSIANHLNEETCCLIRFTEPTDMQPFAEILKTENTECGEYQESNWLGREILDCGCADCCIVVRLDEKTFMIGNKERLGAAFQSQQPTSPLIAKWTRELAQSKFRGEMFLGADLSKADWDALPLPKFDERVELVKAIESVAFTVDLDGSKLFDCTAGCESSVTAEKIKTTLEEGLAMYLDSADQWARTMSGQVGAANALDSEANLMVELARGVKFAQKNRNLTVTLPRPEGFAEMVETMMSAQTQFQEPSADFETRPSAVEVKPVLVWKRKIKKGSKVQPADVVVEQWPAQLIPENAFDDDSQVVGRNLKTGSNRGMPIMGRDLEPATP